MKPNMIWFDKSNKEIKNYFYIDHLKIKRLYGIIILLCQRSSCPPFVALQLTKRTSNFDYNSDIATHIFPSYLY